MTLTGFLQFINTLPLKAMPLVGANAAILSAILAMLLYIKAEPMEKPDQYTRFLLMEYFVYISSMVWLTKSRSLVPPVSQVLSIPLR